jgi:hypothetical protein
VKQEYVRFDSCMQHFGRVIRGMFLVTCLFFCAIDMLAATSVLQQEATEIRSQRVNWQSYHQ